MSSQMQHTPTLHAGALTWVQDMAALCQPDRVRWCDGSETEKNQLIRGMPGGPGTDRTESQGMAGMLLPSLASQRCGARGAAHVYLHAPRNRCRSHEQLDGAHGKHRKLGSIFNGSMKGRTLYVVPFLMGPAGSPFQKVGIN